MHDAQLSERRGALDRRRFLRTTVLGGGALLVAACQSPAPAAPPAATTAPAPKPTTPPAKPAAAATSATGKPAAAATAAPKPAEAAKPAAAPTTAPQTAPAATANNFYAGKTVNLITFSSPGGSTELQIRIVMKHLPRFVPGNPTMGTIEYMRGGGGLTQANHFMTNVRGDGLTLGHMSSTLHEDWALGKKEVKFDLSKIELIADVLPQNHRILFVKAGAGFDTVEEAFANPKKLNVGVPDIGHDFYVEMRLAELLFGGKLKVNQVPGYDSDEIDLAIERGELEGRYQSAPAFLAKYRQQFTGGKYKVLWSSEPERFSEMPNVPTLVELVKQHSQPLTETEQALMDFKWTTGRYARYYAFPPNTPKDRVEVFRDAFKDMSADPEFRREMKDQVQVDVTYTSGADMLPRFLRMNSAPQPAKDLWLHLATAKPLPPRA